jgi:hypothetical protein
MAAGRPVDDNDRARVAELHGQGLSCSAIAREIGRARSTVSKIAAEAGLPFDRAQTRSATRAKVADAKARRADLAALAIDDAHAMRRRALDSDAGRDARDFAHAYGIFIDRHIALTNLDADTGIDDGKAMLTDLAEALGQAWRAGQTDDA